MAWLNKVFGKKRRKNEEKVDSISDQSGTLEELQSQWNQSISDLEGTLAEDKIPVPKVSSLSSDRSTEVEFDEDKLADMELLHRAGLKWKIGDTLKAQGIGFKIAKIFGGPGKSGMGVVYVVFNGHESLVFAAKTFQPKFLDNPGAIASFKQEARIWINLEKHPNIVTAHHMEEVDHQPFIFMGFIDGTDLRQKIGAPLKTEEILKYSIHFCRGMIHAGKKIPNFMHRDVKPENCLITQDGTLKVTDFGLAKSATATSEKRLAGTPPYIAPEIWSDNLEIDNGVDIYAFGVMLYEMLTGKWPFSAPDLKAWKYVHLESEPVAPHKIHSDALPELSDLSMKCLMKKRKERPGNFEEIYSVLEELLNNYFGKQIPEPTRDELDAHELNNKGTSLDSLGLYDEAIECFNKAIEIAPNRAVSYSNRANARNDMGDVDGAMGDYNKAIEIDPEYAQGYHNRGGLLVRKGNFDAAIADFDKAIEIDPLYANAFYGRALVCEGKGELEGAINNYSKAAEINPRDFECICRRGSAYYEKGDISSAISDFDKVIEINAKYVSAFINRGSARVKKSDFNGAADDFTKAIGIDPSNYVSYYNRGLVRKEMNDLDGAIADFNKAIEINPEDADIYYARGLALGKRGDTEGLYDFMKVLKLSPEHPAAQVIRDVVKRRKDKPSSRESGSEEFNSTGALFANMGRIDEALENFNRAIQLNPNNAEAHANRGGILFTKGDFRDAIIDYTRAIEINPGFAGAYYSRGKVREKIKDLDGAIADFSKAIEIGPRDAEFYLDRGSARKAKGDLDGAMVDYGEAIGINPNYTKAYLKRGELHLTRNNPDGVIDDLNKALKMNPNSDEGHVNRGVALGMKGDIDGAIADFNKAVSINPSCVEAYGNRGYALINKGDPEGALRDYQKFVEIAPPDHPMVQRVLKIMDGLKSASGLGQEEPGMGDYKSEEAQVVFTLIVNPRLRDEISKQETAKWAETIKSFAHIWDVQIHYDLTRGNTPLEHFEAIESRAGKMLDFVIVITTKKPIPEHELEKIHCTMTSSIEEIGRPGVAWQQPLSK